MNPSRLFGRLRTLTHARVATALALPLAGCSAIGPATFHSTTNAVYQDAASPAGRKLLADVTAAALRMGLDLAAGRDADAVLAGIQGAASAVRDYEGLPVAPVSTTVARAAASGPGVARVAAALTPAVRDLLEDARQSATQHNVRITTDDLIEALARGLDAVATSQPSATPTHL